MQKVILLATSHDIQHGKRLNPEYINHIKSLIEKYDIKSISEEINDDKEYLTEKFCKENSISYKIIEPNDTVEKPALGIKTLKEIDIDMLNKYVVPDNPAESPRLESWPNPANEETLPSDIYEDFNKANQKAYRQREKEWLKRIVKLDTYPSLVIFGANHLDEFSKLLQKNGIEIRHYEKFGVEE